MNTTTQANQQRGLTVRLEEDVFHVINKQCAVRKMKLGEFAAYVLECYVLAVEPSLRQGAARNA